jgi:hypothetical protein
MNILAQGANAWAPTFLIRTYHWPVTKAALTIGAISVLFGMTGALGSGAVVDHLFRRGMRDAHLRYYGYATPLLAVCGVAAYLARDPIMSVAGISATMLIMPMVATSLSALHVTTPSAYRGRVSSIFLFIFNVLGAAAGPSVVAGISDFALGGRGQIGPALAITFAVVAPLSALAFWLGVKPLREAIDAQRDYG